ncbi:sulfite exporter TauE/SafE family protein [Corallincola luteus]|uniref:Sulfite exporter TauE/SafE family protein n=2 Tax=Corallincola TaxID=1775176 RepID=A0A368NSK4_9GAMM|nr:MULTISPECIES: sulfite exporter TauE/SafE family protein [Corallincola]RCU52684.1 sulfite exporter TauE/SafE family protein [Corallincola holothuriorum]TCI03184.1 sulfite exporter TauE/SafE family protein [Corallincola luteus]
MIENQVVAAFMVGVLGSGHCAGMCGGLASAILTGTNRHAFLRSLFLSLGRVSSYAIAGALIASASTSLTSLSALKSIVTAFQLLAGLMIVLAGLYISGWYLGLAKFELVGQGLWRKLQPISVKFLPITSLKSAACYGFLWGWLPCGLVYSTLTWTLSADSPWHGAAIMLAFGIGTMPTMIGIGTFSEQVKRVLKNKQLRNLFGIMVISLGLLTLYSALERTSWF